MPSDLKPVAGSQRTPLRNAKAVGKVDLKHHIEVTVRVRSRSADAEWDARIMETNSKHPSERTYLSREDLAAHRGADPEDLAKIDAFAHAHHLTVIETSIPKRTVRLAGTADDLSHAFGVRLRMYRSKDIIYRGRSGPVLCAKQACQSCRRRVRAGQPTLRQASLSTPLYHTAQQA